MTVTGTNRPSSSNSWVIPSLRPIRPLTGIVATSLAPGSNKAAPPGSQLDLDVHTRRQVQTHEGVDRLRRRVEDVDQALVGPHLELLADVLLAVGRHQHRVDGLLSRQGHRPGNPGAGPASGIDDALRGLVQHAVINSPQPDADLLRCHRPLTPPGSSPGSAAAGSGGPVRGRAGARFTAAAPTRMVR